MPIARLSSAMHRFVPICSVILACSTCQASVGGTEDVDRLETAIEAMRDAKQRIDDKDTGRETQELQEQAVSDLEELLERLKNQQQRSKNNSQQNQNQNQNQNQDQEQNQERSRKQRQQSGQERGNPQNSSDKKSANTSADPRQGKRNPDKARDSQARSDADRQTAEEQSRRALLVKDVWGHLPPHVRAAMQNAFSEKYLPKYEELVKKYYESLAEKNKKGKK